MNLIEVVARRTKQAFRLSDDSRFVCAIRPRYDSVLQYFYGRTGLLRTIHGERPIRLHPCARLIREEYEPPVFSLLKQTIKPGFVILDVGANIGVLTIFMARWSEPGGHVHAFEPHPTANEALIKHVCMNRLSSSVTVRASALSDIEGITAFYAAKGSHHSSLSDINVGPDAEQIRVPVTTIDAYCRLLGIKPSLIKIDVEGLEFSVLAGARNTLRECRPLVIVELHPLIWPVLAIDAHVAIGQLAELHYSVTAIEKQFDMFSEYGHIMLAPIQ